MNGIQGVCCADLYVHEETKIIVRKFMVEKLLHSSFKELVSVTFVGKRGLRGMDQSRKKGNFNICYMRVHTYLYCIDVIYISFDT